MKRKELRRLIFGVGIAIGFFGLGTPIGTTIAIPIPTPMISGYGVYLRSQ